MLLDTYLLTHELHHFLTHLAAMEKAPLHSRLVTWRCPVIFRHLKQIQQLPKNHDWIHSNVPTFCLQSVQQVELLIESFVVLQLLVLCVNYIVLARGTCSDNSSTINLAEVSEGMTIIMA